MPEGAPGVRSQELEVSRNYYEEQQERTRLPIHNILTGLVVAVLGVWIVSSAGNVLTLGVVVGLGCDCLLTFGRVIKKDWFWMFAREFSIGEIRVIGESGDCCF